MKVKLLVLLISFFPISSSFSQFFKVLESDYNHIKISVNFEHSYSVKQKNIGLKNFNYIEGGFSFKKRGEPWVPSEDLKIGIPLISNPNITVTNLNQEKINNVYLVACPDSINQPFDKLYYNSSIYQTNDYFPKTSVESSYFMMRYLRVASLEISPYQYNPVTRELIFNKSFIINVNYNQNEGQNSNFSDIADKMTKDFSESLLNATEAKNFITKENFSSDGVLTHDSSWYSPAKDFYKIYLNKKGLYRVSYEQLINSGVPGNNGLQDGKLELFNMGKKVPLEIMDKNNNGIFDAGDFFQFIGFPAPPADSFTYFNIYNLSNVYWFSYQADSVFNYKSIDGFPVDFSSPQIRSTMETRHFEEDKLRQNLGYAPDDKRDFWLWEFSEARNYNEYLIFTYWIEDTNFVYNFNPQLPEITLRANVQGITNTNCNGNGNGHSANIKFNVNTVVNKKWDGQNSVTLEATFPVVLSGSGIPFSARNKFEVALDGDICESTGSDLAMINWFEFSYWRWNSVRGNFYDFKNPPNRIGKNLYFLSKWFSDSIKVYIPQRGEYILNARINHDAEQTVQFQDSIGLMTEYMCYGHEDFLTPDSIMKDISSDLSNINQGVDYLIITHPSFKSVAQKLANFRSTHLQGYDNPRVKIVDINDIYDEFSYGLLNPAAVQEFIKYVFEKWQSPTLAYVSLIGDMSFDYRHIFYNGKHNFIPSMPYQAIDYGQAPSDNIFVAVAGNDIIPDLAIGRISCETVEEGNIQVDKIINYPSDNGKDWKQNVLLMASGMDELDELTFGFNDFSEILDTKFLKKNGIHSSKVYRFPNKPEYLPYQGSGPKIREEINKGAVVANYYGHGGGGQWDLTFVNDDIYQLNNQNRLPFVISVTCYTAHFADQTIFGEIFNRVPGKGSIAFYGSSGLTWWQAGTYFNDLLFNEIFNKKYYTVGQAILNSKSLSTGNPYYLSQITLLHLLGDPALELALPKKPDFVLNTSSFSHTPEKPLKGDTVDIKIKIRNLGIDFEDSVTVALYHTRIDTSTLIGQTKIAHFGEIDSVSFSWILQKAGLYNLICEVNSDNIVDEDDHSDNKAYEQLVAFDFSEPNIVKPLNGAICNNKVNFTLVDVGDYVGRNFKYQIKIDSSIDFNSSSLISSPILLSQNGVVKWSSPQLNLGEYFWKALIFDAVDTNKSKIYKFTVKNDVIIPGYLVQNKHLKYLEKYNMNYNENNHSLLINTELLSPKPSDSQLLDTMRITLPDSTALNSFATDGSYYYFTRIPFYWNYEPGKIYKVGTGLHGTIRGKVESPFPNKIYSRNSMFCYGDYLYSASTGRTLLRIDKNNGDTLSITLGDDLIPSLDGLIQDSSYYLGSDGNLVYNLSAGYGVNRFKYILRTFDPNNSWNKIGKDLVFDGSSTYGFTGFFIVNGKLYTYESFNSGYIRRYDIATQDFEEEWLLLNYMSVYTLCYDWVNNNIIGSGFRPVISFPAAFYRFKGTYKDAKANVNSDDIGPAYKWSKIQYEVDSLNYQGTFNVNLLGLNHNSGQWDTLEQKISPVTLINNINTKTYEYLKLNLSFIDSSYGITEPIKLKSISAEYTSCPEISVNSKDISFVPDTLMQGFNTELTVKVLNVGDTNADSVAINYSSNDSDSAFIYYRMNIPHDSSVVLKNVINTSSWAPATLYNIKVYAKGNYNEQFTFNDLSQKSFFVSRDSVNPQFQITFDGKEINSGDIVSAKPKVVITLKDNSPLPLDTTMFTLMFSNRQSNQPPFPLYFSRPDIKYFITPYPNSELKIEWEPEVLPDGNNFLDILAKDASGNFFDSVAHRIEFVVFNQTDLKNVFNYPNPFKNDTYFTFEIHGQTVPEEFTIKIFTVAGRLIRNIIVPLEDLNIGFNKIHWDGKDQDSDEVANGLYFYKIISKNNGVIKTAIQKLAKVK